MKKILSSIIYILGFIIPTQAQILFGTTSGGGMQGGGTLNKVMSATNSFTVVKSFESLSFHPYDNFIQATDGKLYALTSEGGNSDLGVIFSFDPISGKYTKLKDFDTDDGSPKGSLIQATDGKLYGTTADVIFSFEPVSGKYTKLKTLDYTQGSGLNGSLMQAVNGKLYGMTNGGGNNEEGVIFSFDPNTSTYLKLLDFDGINGGEPRGSFIQASNGKLYGMTVNGGDSRMGNIFSFDPSTSTYARLKDFDNSTGGYPDGSLIQAGNGKLYGMTSRVIFSFDPAFSKFTKLKDFDNTTGWYPDGSFVQATNGKLYGMSTYGGIYDAGVIFSFDPSTSACIKLKDFNETNGGNPYGSLMKASNGKLYGLTTFGGSRDGGIIFSFDPSSSKYTKLRDIASNENGSYVSGGLIRASNKKLYGVTEAGGINNMGVIFSYDPSSSIYTKLRDLDSANGAQPYDGLIQASNGKLYGLTNSGGSRNAGVIFSFDPSSSKYTKLKDFDSPNGYSPYGSLIQANNGKLYGLSTFGGSGEAGTIFSFDPFALTFTKLKDFGGTDGKAPYGSLLQASNGKLYGMTYYGGNNDQGVLFSFDLPSSTYTKLLDFDGLNGAYPDGTLLQASDGKLYGMTPDGGVGDSEYSYGLIFSFDPSNSKYTKLKEFDYSNGFNPSGSLMQASNGKLYGTTNAGGIGGPDEDGNGAIFSFDPLSSTFTKIDDFVGPNGIHPNSPFIEVDGCIAGTTYYRDSDSDGYGDNSNSVVGCPIPAGYVYNNNDCNDLNPSIHPGTAEVCNSLDDDCNGQIDSTTHEAEKAVLNGAPVMADQPGYTGSGYADFQSGQGHFIEWRINAIAGLYSLRFRYANGGVANRNLKLTINGVVVAAIQVFSPTGGWAFWSVSSLSASLIAGTNKIRLTTTGAQGPNVDNLTVAIIGCQTGYLEAELAVLNGAAVASSQPGYTGSGYADYNSGPGHYIEWTVASQVAGSYSLKFRFANGSTANRPLELKVNGVVVAASLAFSPTGGWATWQISSATASLIAGTNKVRLTTRGPQGPNVDNLTLEMITCQPGTLEAEQAVFNGAVITAEQPGFTGSGYLDYNSGSGNYIEWSVNASVAGLFSLQFRYANGGTANRPLKLTINGVVVAASLAFSPTGGWAFWSVWSSQASLIAGANKVRLTTIGSQGPNVDNLAFSCNNSAAAVQLAVSAKGLLPELPELPGTLKAIVTPNPVYGSNAKLVLITSSNMPVDLQLVDISGKSYQSLTFVLKGSNTLNIPVKDLPPGAYVILLKQGNVHTHARLVVGGK